MLKLKVITQNTARIIEINGEVDMYSSPEVREVLLQLVDIKAPTIVLDFRNVVYIDSSGIATLVEALQEVGKYKGDFILANLSKNVLDVFELSRLDKVFDIYNSLEEALKSSSLYGNHK